MDSHVEQIKTYVEQEFHQNVLPSLMDFVRIPNLSRDYDKEWQTNGLLEQAADHLYQWVMAQNIKGLQAEQIQLPGLSPFLFIQIQGSDTQKDNTNVLMYGHLDKQPHFSGWKEGTGPVSPVVQDGRLYGRGCSDDGYSLYAAILSVKTLQHYGLSHPRITITIEADEESGSGHIDAYLAHLKEPLSKVDYVICLDSGAYDYQRLWLTTSLRGNLVAKLTVQVLQQGVHSGLASGLVPSSFRITRQLLDRIEDVQTGQVVDDFQVVIPQDRQAELNKNAALLGTSQFKFPFVGDCQPVSQDALECFTNKTWRAQLSVTGADGFPPCSGAGNVLRPQSTLKLSLRLPPTKDPKQASAQIKAILEDSPPYNAQVKCEVIRAGSGFNAENLQSVM